MPDYGSLPTDIVADDPRFDTQDHADHHNLVHQRAQERTFDTVVWGGDNNAARPDADTVYWKGWPEELTPANSVAGDLVFTPASS